MYKLENFSDFADAVLNRMCAIESKLENKEQERFLTVRDVMSLFNLKTKQSVYNWVSAGHLKIHKVGNRTFFKRSEINMDMLKKYSHL